MQEAFRGLYRTIAWAYVSNGLMSFQVDEIDYQRFGYQPDYHELPWNEDYLRLSHQAMRIVYRTDSDDFADGRDLYPRGDHTNTMNAKLRAAEELIRSGKADGPKIRSNCIYVWETRESGESNWHHEKDKHLYELEIDEADILHIGDAYLLATIAAIDDSQAAAKVVQSYWNGDTQGNRTELLVTKAKVLRKLRDKSEPRPKLLNKSSASEERDQDFLKRLNHGDE
jgi:hypothetical protein